MITLSDRVNSRNITIHINRNGNCHCNGNISNDGDITRNVDLTHAINHNDKYRNNTNGLHINSLATIMGTR